MIAETEKKRDRKDLLPPGDFERIEPAPLRPAAGAQTRPRRTGRPAVLAILTGVALLSLLVLAILVFRWSPEHRPARSPHLNTTAPPVSRTLSDAPQPAAPDAEAVLAARGQVQHLRDEWTAKWGRLEQQSVERWAGERGADAGNLADEGNRRFEARDYSGAADSYRQAIGIADALLEQAKTVLADALARGARALLEQHGEEAQQAFSLAHAVDPDNAAAKKGMERAQNLDQVLALLRSGRAHEQAGELSAATADYRQVLELDEAVEEARDALARIEKTRAEGEFRQSMARGLTALEHGDYAAARDAFQTAARIRPHAPEVADGLTQAEAGLALQAIAEHRARAEAFENNEQWREALAEYQAALAVDSTLAFAQAGSERAQARAELTELLQYHIDHPQRLAAANVRAAAEATLAKAGAVSGPGPVLKRQSDELASLLAAAQTPVPVRLRSDNRTTVHIYRVGDLGTFESREIQLLPGTYTAIGRCEGYRDVRREFSVMAGELVGPIVIRCEEKI